MEAEAAHPSVAKRCQAAAVSPTHAMETTGADPAPGDRLL